MIFLLLAVALCLLVPWLPVMLYRSLPRRPPDPLSAEQLHRLAAQLRRDGAVAFVEVSAADDDAVTADPDRPPEPAPDIPVASAGESEPERALPPERAGPSPEADPLPRLTLGSYRWPNVLMGLVLIVTFLALGLGWALVFEYLGEQRARSLPAGVFLFTPTYGLVCAVPALFLGILSSIPALMVPARLLMGRRRFLEYLFWDEGRMGPGSADRVIKLFTGIALLASLGSAGFVGLVLNWYTRFGEDEIAIKGLFAPREEAHSYADVVQIVLTRERQQGKEVVPSAVVGLRFRDGRTWSTGQAFPAPSSPFERDRLLDFLRRKTGKDITRVRLLKDAPGW
jgi:hypothetical protein